MLEQIEKQMAEIDKEFNTLKAELVQLQERAGIIQQELLRKNGAYQELEKLKTICQQSKDSQPKKT